MKYPWAVPGAKVVCVDASKGPMPPPPRGVTWFDLVQVQQGQTYTISSACIHPYTGDLCVTLKGLAPRCRLDFGYRVDRFRPLHTKESDVALFAHLLTPAPNAPMLPAKELTDQ